jgi:lysophospholipase L1-like esterase
VSFRAGGDWARVLSSVNSSKSAYTPYVTIQFGHNDQKVAANISVLQFTTNLETMVSDVRAAGGTPILVTSLSRRNFNETTGKVILDLAPQVAATLVAAQESKSAYIDLNKYSMAYLNAVGETDALLYDRIAGDNTHLNVGGDFLFGNLVGWLIERSAVGRDVEAYICTNKTIIRDIEEGVFILPVNTTAS